MTTLGVIGLGRIGAFHTDTLSGLDSIDGLVVTDERPEVVAAVAAKHGAKPADSVEALLAPAWTASSSRPPRPRTPS